MNNVIINIKQKEILSEIFSALEFAAFKHRRQRRKGAGEIPYINHPIEVTHLILRTVEEPSKELIIAALLHDLLEDTDTTDEDIRSKFGGKVLNLVEEVTDDMKLPKRERKRLQILKVADLTAEAQYIKIADKACNIRDIISTRLYWSRKDKIDYIAWACQVVEKIKNVHGGLISAFRENLREAENRLDCRFDFTI